MVSHLVDSTEMYLRTVLELEEEGIPPLRARLAERLALSAPSISEGVARLEEDGLLRLAKDRTVELTDVGREIATHVMRKHRLAERLLADVVGLEPEYIHEEACRWEHVISDRVEDKLAELLGNPTTSPYGNPIPGGPASDYQPLSLAEAEDGTVRIERISELLQKDRDLMTAFESTGIRAGKSVGVVQGPDRVTIDFDGAEVDLDHHSARLVYVSPA